MTNEQAPKSLNERLDEICEGLSPKDRARVFCEASSLGLKIISSVPIEEDYLTSRLEGVDENLAVVLAKAWEAVVMSSYGRSA